MFLHWISDDEVFFFSIWNYYKREIRRKRNKKGKRTGQRGKVKGKRRGGVYILV
jgi:hypothetical protein